MSETCNLTNSEVRLFLGLGEIKGCYKFKGLFQSEMFFPLLPPGMKVVNLFPSVSSNQNPFSKMNLFPSQYRNGILTL